MLGRHQAVLGFLLATALWAVFFVLQSEPSAHYQICETNQYTEHETCTPHHLLYVAFWYIGYVINPVSIGAIATAAIAVFTYTLYKATNGLVRTAEIQSVDMKRSLRVSESAADAAKISAEITKRNFEYTFRARISMSHAAVVRREDLGEIDVEYTLENAGVLPATRLMESFSVIGGPEWHPPTRDSIYMAPQIEQMSLVLNARAVEQRKKFIRDFAISEYEKAQAGGFYIRVGIIVVYIDGFENERTTWKWFEWNPETNAFRECAARQD